jgi:Predicted transcriptional regulators
MGGESNRASNETRGRLVDAGGRFAQDFGFSKIPGQALMLLYLGEEAASLDDVAEALGVSKAAASMACAQLEALGLIVRERRKGDRKCYYRSADNLQHALTVGIAGFVRTEVAKLDSELRAASAGLSGAEDAFLKKRVQRLSKLSEKARRVLESPILNLVAKIAK